MCTYVHMYFKYDKKQRQKINNKIGLITDRELIYDQGDKNRNNIHIIIVKIQYEYICTCWGKFKKYIFLHHKKPFLLV